MVCFDESTQKLTNQYKAEAIPFLQAVFEKFRVRCILEELEWSLLLLYLGEQGFFGEQHYWGTVKSYTILEAGCQKVDIFVYEQKRIDEG